MNPSTYYPLVRALSNWLDGAEHKEGCMFGHVVQSGPAEGNKIPCTCGLTELQNAAHEVIR